MSKLRILAKHTLDTSSPRSLTQDLSGRLKAPIKLVYSHFNPETYDIEYEIGYEFGIDWDAPPHTIEIALEEETSGSLDDFFMKKDYEVSLYYPEKENSFRIGIDTLETRKAIRWSVFVTWLTDPNYWVKEGEPFRQYIEHFRQELKTSIGLFGCNEILVFNENGDFGTLPDEINTMKFDEIKSYLEASAGGGFRTIKKELSGYEGKDIYENPNNFKVFYDIL
ncbi:MAG: hypothetical protein MUF45_08135 [Spirosomaceae bacterium]|jgi:hypothetical protein|nr:hypothetical protein [Spirosomataceae bacterium]